MTGFLMQELRRCSSTSQLTIDLLSKWFFNYRVIEWLAEFWREYVHMCVLKASKTARFRNSIEILLGFFFFFHPLNKNQCH